MELSEIREKIDTVDEALLKLFLERMALSEDVAAAKAEQGLPISNRTREREILAKVTAEAGDKERYAYHLFTTLFHLSRARQAELIGAPTQVAARCGPLWKQGARSSPRRVLWPVRAWRAPTHRPPATAFCLGATSSM